MAKLSFRLTHKDSPDHSEIESISLMDVANHVRNKINMPFDWFIEELEDGEMVQLCNAGYFIEKYKPNDEHQPLTVTDAIYRD